MAQYIATDDINDLVALGYTTAELETRPELNLYWDGTNWWTGGRSGEHAIARLLTAARQRVQDQARREQLAEGRLVEWRLVAGAWLLAGAELTPGDIVTVTRRDGSTSRELVGEIVAHRDGLVLARPARL